jgi:hypothetical protein
MSTLRMPDSDGPWSYIGLPDMFYVNEKIRIIGQELLEGQNPAVAGH